MTFGERIKSVRKDFNLTQEAFAARIGLKQNSIAQIEADRRNVSDQVILSISRVFGYREEWLRTGEGPEKNDDGITREMTELVSRLFTERPETFKAKLLTVLLRFDPNSDQWKMLEDIFRLVAAEMHAAPVQDPNAPADLDSTDAQHAELDRLAALEKGDAGKSEASLSTG
jgi:transcriptional regulator with XRE-family HTH domain